MTWFDDKQNDIVNIPTVEVKSITYSDNGIGIGDGAIAGATSLFSIGFILGILAAGGMNPGGGGPSGTFAERIGVGALLGFLVALPGSLIGGIVGVVIGADTTFEIN